MAGPLRAVGFDVDVARANRTDSDAYDICYSSAWYDPRHLQHPCTVTQLSSYSYWATSLKAVERAHLLDKWNHLAVKNKTLSNRLEVDRGTPVGRVLYHQVDPHKWPYKHSGGHYKTFRVGYAGHKSNSKGWQMIQDACNDIGATFVPQFYEDRIRPSAMPEYYHNLDAYVSMSVQEGGPRTGIEATLCGVPTILGEPRWMGQVHEQVRDQGLPVWVVPRTVRGLAEALRRLRGNPGQRKYMSVTARRMMEATCREALVGWVSLFQEIRDEV